MKYCENYFKVIEDFELEQFKKSLKRDNEEVMKISSFLGCEINFKEIVDFYSLKKNESKSKVAEDEKDIEFYRDESFHDQIDNNKTLCDNFENIVEDLGPIEIHKFNNDEFTETLLETTHTQSLNSDIQKQIKE